MVEKFLSFIKSQNLFQSNEPVLLAVSGGIDSTVMSHLFKRCRFAFAMAHMNFQLRDTDSVDDEKFAASLALNLGVSFFSTRVNTRDHADKNKISIQMAARELRYEWLEKIRKENGYHLIATAHHQDDCIETVLLNIFRGTGIHGLHGILPKQQQIIRPMRSFFKQEIEAFADKENIVFRQDQSNFDTHYDRNKIRLDIIPVIEKEYPAFQQVFAENISRWQDAERLYENQLLIVKKKLVERKGDEVLIPILKMMHLPASKTILYEILKDFGFTHEQSASIHSCFTATSGKMFYSESHRLLKDRKHLMVSKISTENISEILIAEGMQNISSSMIQIKIELRDAGDFQIPKNSAIACLDYGELEFPLLLRKWKKGDYFYPLGMKKKKKKISDYLIDRKIPLTEKENIRVIESGKRIACIIGQRIDERFKINAATKKIMIIKKS